MLAFLFFQLLIRALVAKIWPDKVVRWYADGDFFASIFSEPYAARFTPASSIHTKATPCVKVWYTSNLRRLRLGEEKKIELECGPMPNLMVALPNIGGALCSTPQSLADAHY